MNKIQIRGQVNGWSHVGGVLAILIVLIAFGTALNGFVPGWFLGSFGLLGVILYVAHLAYCSYVRAWISETETGFIVEDRKGRREFPLSDVTAASLQIKTNLSNGTPNSTTRTLILWLGQNDPLQSSTTIRRAGSDPYVPPSTTNGEQQRFIPRESIKCVATSPLNVQDSLAPFAARVVEDLSLRLEQQVRDGGSASGDGWLLNKTTLTTLKSKQAEYVPLFEITAVESFSGKMCVWRRGQDEAFVSFPLESRNAFLLPALLAPYLTTPSNDGQPPQGLGRILFERHGSALLAWGLFIVAIGCLIFVAFMLMAGIARADDKVTATLFTLGAIVAAPFIAVGGWHTLRTRFRCHERGVSKRGIYSEDVLMYASTEKFTYSATRHYHNGAYTGTSIGLNFRPAKGSGKAIAYSTSAQGSDKDIDELRDFISRSIASAMAQRLQAGETVEWTPNMRFGPEGLHYRPSGFISRGDFKFLPFSAYSGYNVNEGTFYLFSSEAKTAVASESCAAENFWPGFYLLLFMCHTPSEKES